VFTTQPIPLKPAAPSHALAPKLDYLNQIGIALSQEKDIHKLLETILVAAKKLTHSDAGTLYRLVDDRLEFEIVRTDSLSIAMGGTAPDPISFYPIPLYDAEGKPNYKMIATYAALTRKTVNVADAYAANEFDFSGPRNFDKRTGYRSTSFLTVPMKNHEGTVIGVLQLLNRIDPQGGAVVAFSAEDQHLAESLASQAAMALTNATLIQQLEGMRSVRREILGATQSKFMYLVIDNVLTAPELELAMRTARQSARHLEEVLRQDFQVRDDAIGAALAKFYGVGYEPYRLDRSRPSELRNIKRDYAEANGWLPIAKDGEEIVVMSTDPDRLRNSRSVENVFPRARIVYRVTTEHDFSRTLGQCFGYEPAGSGESIGDLLSALVEEKEDKAESTTAEMVCAASDNEIVKLVNKVIVDAYIMGASDIHVESLPGTAKTGIRLRRDGSLHPYIEIPSTYRDGFVMRIKIMCDLDIAEKRKPQDGKIKFSRFGPLDIELRVATLPMAGGVEDVVMRMLSAGEPIPLAKLGLLPVNLERLVPRVSKPYGLFLVCGPTGSGKTTTLHSVLGYLNKPDTKILTAEDPVEITQKGLRQCQVNAKAGFTFAAAMRSFLRSDPDVIMVGEMRDPETTAIGIEASITGHLVFSTLHTNSAPESIVRLLDMGMDPFNFADALLGILAQRLAKRLCKCKVAYVPKADELDLFVDEYCEELGSTQEFVKDADLGRKRVLEMFRKEYGVGQAHFRFYRPNGCDECGETGYRGRIGLHELMIATDTLKRLIQQRARVADLLVQALNDGMITLKMDGMNKVLQGLTDMSQVRAVCIK
jgi:type II secretory ATPase GspE/PulE/Tfp pilus assembly ATPase PilB-like protein